MQRFSARGQSSECMFPGCTKCRKIISYEQTCKLAVLSGAYTAKYCTTKSIECSSLPSSHPDIYKYYKLVKTSSKPKISTVTRQKLLFKYGGTRLPDNYMDWFDG